MMYVGVEMPDEPISDYDTHSVINTFWLANRSRSYLSGITVSPLPLTVKDISDVLAVYPVLMDRHMLDKAVFAIDDEYLKMAQDSNKL